MPLTQTMEALTALMAWSRCVVPETCGSRTGIGVRAVEGAFGNLSPIVSARDSATFLASRASTYGYPPGSNHSAEVPQHDTRVRSRIRAGPRRQHGARPAAGAWRRGSGRSAGPRHGAAPSPFKKFADLVKGATRREGYFETYEKGENLYLVIPKDRLGKDFLMEMKIAQGIGAAGLFGGTMLNIFEGQVMALERRGDRVMLVQRPHRYTAHEGGAAARAVELTFGVSVIDQAKIESVRDDSAIVINTYDWWVSDLSGIGQAVRFVASTTPGRPGTAAFDKPRSYLESVKSFPQNTNVRAKLTFRPGEPVGFASVPDGRYISLSIHYTLAALPENPMTPRLGDDRVGNFLTVHKDFSQEDSTTFMRYVNRWRLEPGERVGDLWRPKQPITYYIDPNVPDEYRGYMKAGVEVWNKAFEAAGWKDAIRALPLPEGADPEDIRYSTLRWNVSDQPGYGAIGPSVVDPRTGEVLDADILFESTMFGNFRTAWRNLVNPSTAAEAFNATLAFSEADLNQTRNAAASWRASALRSRRRARCSPRCWSNAARWPRAIRYRCATWARPRSG